MEVPVSGKVRCRACGEYIPKEEALPIPLGHVCNKECLQAVRAREQKKKAKRSTGNPIPPEVRRAVKQRDGNCCRMCRSNKWLNAHHIVYRSHGGTHTERNLIMLCRAHHEMVHSNGKYWQPILLGVVAEQYATGRFYLVGQYEALYSKQLEGEFVSG